MDIDIENKPSYASALVVLEPGESITSESEGMVEMSADIRIETDTRSRGGGGFFSGMKRMLASESFFLSHFTADRERGHVVLAPTLPGDIIILDMQGENWVVQGGSYLASGDDIQVDMQMGGLRSMLGGEGLFFVHLSGRGPALISSFGGLYPVDVDGSYIVDTGHLVAFEEGLEYKIRKAGGWKSFFFSGEGLVMEFQGRGRIWLQTHDRNGYGSFLGRMLPPREN